MMAAFGEVGREPVPGLACARNRSMSLKARPAPNAPIFRKFRRLRPSQNRCLEPNRFNMAIPLWSELRTVEGQYGFRGLVVWVGFSFIRQVNHTGSAGKIIILSE